MKLVKRTFALLLTLAVMLTVLAMPALAGTYTTVPSRWLSYIGAFPQISRYDYTGNEKYVLALQRYLMCFDTESQNKLYYGGQYMDGSFGGRTEAAAVYCQGKLGVAADGYVGPNTWSAIASSLRLYTQGMEKNKIKRPTGINGWVFMIALSGDKIEELYYVLEDNSNIQVI